MDKASNHIYIVDDDRAYGKSLVWLLKSVGYSVESFSSAQSFLDAVRLAHKTGVRSVLTVCRTIVTILSRQMNSGSFPSVCWEVFCVERANGRYGP